MGKFASRRNFGYGKKIECAGHQALVTIFGKGHFSTVAGHTGRWGRFCQWAHAVHDIRDARGVGQPIIEDYAAALSEQVIDESMKVSYAQNLLTSVNVTLEALRKDHKVRIDSPSQWVGRRCTIRMDQPTGLSWETVNGAVTRLNEIDLPRAAVVVQLARSFGVRLREAVLLDISAGERQAHNKGAIDVRKGTKGGRGKDVERWVPISEEGKQALLEAARVRDALGCGNNLLRPDESYNTFVNDREINRARRYLHQAGIKGYHDLRSAWACDRYQQLTGHPAPVFQPDTRIDPEKDRKAREALARELGHDRIGVVAEYIGARP